jgi:uncharacterized protein YdeI (YjbR/CyaY-like superfamily)
MKQTDIRIDNYIVTSAPFAQPILTHLRELIHKTCPDVEETMKWNFPHFSYKGQILCSMASFKQHCAFTFWKAALMKDHLLIETAQSEVAMGHLGRIESIKDLPSNKVLSAYIKEAMALNEKGIKVPKPKKEIKEKEAQPTPDDLQTMLNKNKAAKHTFDNFSYSCRKEYIEWITEAKTEATRNKRLAQAVEWMAEGKIRHWKYARS